MVHVHTSYVGVSNDPQRRFKVHGSKPPSAMRATALLFKPWRVHVHLEVLHRYLMRDHASKVERREIKSGV